MRLDCRENTEAPSFVVQPPHYLGSFFWTPYAYSIHEVPTGKTTLQFSSILPRWPTDQQRCFRTSRPSISFYRRILRFGPIAPFFLIFPGFSILPPFSPCPMVSHFLSFVQYAFLSHIFSRISFHSLPSFSVLFLLFLRFPIFFSTFTDIVHFFCLTLPQNNWTDLANFSYYTRLVWKQTSVRERDRNAFVYAPGRPSRPRQRTTSHPIRRPNRPRSIILPTKRLGRVFSSSFSRPFLSLSLASRSGLLARSGPQSGKRKEWDDYAVYDSSLFATCCLHDIGRKTDGWKRSGCFRL